MSYNAQEIRALVVEINEMIRGLRKWARSEEQDIQAKQET